MTAALALLTADALGADASGIDAAEALLEIAKSRLPNANIQQGGLENLPFVDETFDVVTGFNSLQYSGIPIVAGAACDKTRKHGCNVNHYRAQGFDAPATAGAPGPLALSEPKALKQFARDAGLKPVEVFKVDCPFIYPDKTTAVRGFSSAGVAVRAMEKSSVQAVKDAYADAFSPSRQADGTYRIGATFRCLLARP